MMILIGAMVSLGIAAGVFRSVIPMVIAVLLMGIFILGAPCCRRREKVWFFVLYSSLMIPVHLLWVRDVVMLVYLEGMEASLYDRLYGDVITMALFSAELIALLMIFDRVFGRQREMRAVEEETEERAA